MKVFRENVNTLAGWRRVTYVRANWLERIWIDRGIRKGRYDLLYVPDFPGPKACKAHYIVRPQAALKTLVKGRPVPTWLRRLVAPRFGMVDAIAMSIFAILWVYHPLAAVILLTSAHGFSIWAVVHIAKRDANRIS